MLSVFGERHSMGIFHSHELIAIRTFAPPRTPKQSNRLRALVCARREGERESNYCNIYTFQTRIYYGRRKKREIFGLNVEWCNACEA